LGGPSQVWQAQTIAKGEDTCSGGGLHDPAAGEGALPEMGVSVPVRDDWGSRPRRMPVMTETAEAQGIAPSSLLQRPEHSRQGDAESVLSYHCS
jgi:hypothetical protein